MSLPLIPVTSLNTSRYNNPEPVQLRPQIISGGPTSRSRPVLGQWSPQQVPSDASVEKSVTLTSRWKPFDHPEGQRYFLLPGQFSFDVVTEADVEDEEIQGRILDWVTIASEELYCHDVKVPSRCELFLELGDDRASCNYYFVDHIGKVLFWLKDVCTESLDIPPAASPSHLDTQLERLYWVHIEFFPMHHGPHEAQFSQMVGDLYNVISHGQADRLTSNTSTFPFTEDKCAHFLDLLSRKKDQRVDGYTLCYAARLAGAIANQRFMTFYGQKPAQLDRLQEMFQTNVFQHMWLFNVANRLMWGVPQHYSNLLQDLYVNEQVYASQWTPFMSTCLTDWTTSLSSSLAVFIASVLLANVRGGTITTSIPTALSCAISIVTASCLHLRHQPLAQSSATVGARYLYLANWRTAGLTPSAVVFSLPRAGYLWGIGLLTAQFLFVASQSGNKVVALAAATVISLIMFCVLYVIHPEEASFTSLFQSLTSLNVPRMYTPGAPGGESMV